MSFFNVSIATDQTCYNEYQVTSAFQEIEHPADAPHRLREHRKKRRARHLQDRPWSRATRGE